MLLECRCLAFHWSKQSGDTDASPADCLMETHLQVAAGERTKQSHAELTWLRSSAAERRGGDGSVLGSCSPLLCFLPRERETCLLLGFKWVSIINLPLAQIRQPTILFSVYVFSETLGFMFFLVSTFCSVQVKAAIQELSGTWQCSSSWSYSFNIFVEVKGNWDRLLPILKKSAISCGFCSATCSCG